MTNPFIGEIVGFGGNFAPRGWAFCQGQLLPVAQNTALFSILGTTYGGDGRTTFALPDLQGRAIVHPGNGPGLSDVRGGEKLGVETVTLTTNQMPAHTHTATLYGENKVGPENTPTGNHLGRSAADKIYAAPNTAPDVALAAGSVVVASTGSGGPIPNVSPGLGVSMIIALQGTYPSRD